MCTSSGTFVSAAVAPSGRAGTNTSRGFEHEELNGSMDKPMMRTMAMRMRAGREGTVGADVMIRALELYGGGGGGEGEDFSMMDTRRVYVYMYRFFLSFFLSSENELADDVHEMKEKSDYRDANVMTSASTLLAIITSVSTIVQTNRHSRALPTPVPDKHSQKPHEITCTCILLRNQDRNLSMQGRMKADCGRAKRRCTKKSSIRPGIPRPGFCAVLVETPSIRLRVPFYEISR